MEENKLAKNEVNDQLLVRRQKLEELKEMKNGVEFLISEYHTNKRYFRLEPGRCTTEDVIKTVFEFAWSASRNYMSQQNKNS